MSDTYTQLPPIAATNWKASVANLAALPSSGNTTGDARVALDTGNIYVWNGSSWVGTMDGGATTVGTFDSQAAVANGLVISGVNLYAQSADATHPGMVNTGTQTLAGNKTFTGTIGASNLSGTNTGDISLTAVGSTPSANAASLSGQALTLQPADATHPGVMTTGIQTLAGTKTFSGDTNIANNAGSKATIGGSSSTAIHQINGAIQRTTKGVSTTYTVDTTTTNDILFVDTSGAAFIITLPTPTAGRVITLIDSTGNFGTNNLTLARHGSEKIAGLAASFVFLASWGAWDIISDGTDWYIKG